MASNLTQATRELIDKTWRSAVAYASPILTRMLEKGNVIPGGTRYEQIYESADLTSLVQEYGPNDPLVGGSKEIMEKPHWHVAYIQCPVEESVDERVMNAPKSDAQLIKIRDKIAKASVKAIKLKMLQRMYGCATDNEIDATHTYMQGIYSALFPCEINATATTGTAQYYGGISRDLDVTNTEWCAADDTNWDLAAAINKTNLDNWLDSAMEYDDEAGTYLAVLPTTLYNRLKAIFEAANNYTPKASLSKQGFESMEYSGIEIAKDRALEGVAYTDVRHKTAKSKGGETTTSVYAGLTGDDGYGTGATQVLILNLDTWHLRYFEDSAGGTGPFEMTEFFAQDQVIGGIEKKMARVKWKGNLTCDMPNRNLMRSNVS